jgi:LCP family protein required for cell wall assembly
MMDYKESLKKSISNTSKKEKKGMKKWVKITLAVLVGIFFIGGIVFWRAGSVLNKISVNGNILGSLGRMVPGVSNDLKGEKEGRINILLLGMRGEKLTGGGLLADTIMVASIDPKNNKIALFSIPRDFYVSDPARDSKSKINAVYAYGEERKSGGGIADMEKVVGDIVGQPISYSMAINFQGFTDLVNAIGGVDVDLKEPFEESMQFNEEKACDSYVFTVPTGKWENKISTYLRTNAAGKKVEVHVKKPTYPLCTNPSTECGGNFKLSAGKQTLNGDQALCFARSRKTSSDFERAKRQQLIIQKIKDKALSAGTLTDFNKINGILNSLGDNVRTDMQAWEIKRLWELEQGMKNPTMSQRVLENTEEGLLYNPQQTPETGYILLPIGDNYDKIKDAFANIFNLPAQKDINSTNAF